MSSTSSAPSLPPGGFLHFILPSFFSSAQNVTLSDDSFSTSEFELIHGLLTTSWDRIPRFHPTIHLLHCSNIFFISKANATHTVILRPLSEGVYNLSFAVMTCRANEGEEQEQVPVCQGPASVIF